MSKTGPVIIVEDDKEERDSYEASLANLNISNAIRFFDNGRDAYDYLVTTKEDPFIIICDLIMPAMLGMELRERINANPYLKKKATPFIFRTGFGTGKDLVKAYELSVQGFFKKRNDDALSEQQLGLILGYWKECLEPNDAI